MFDVTHRRVEASDLPKYTAPRRRPDTTRRPRLNRQLQDTLDREITVFCAPAGYGKSTLAVDWLDESGMRYAWLSLDRQDRDPHVFLRNLAGAVTTAFPGSLEEFGRFLAGSATSTEAAVFVGPFAAAVERDIDDLFVLVLDDVHVLAGSSAVDLLDLLIKSVPLNARLLLLTRAWDVLPGLARAVSDRRAFALLQEDLAFDAEEAAQLLRQSGVRDAEVSRRITEQADGWAAALAVLGEHHDVQAPDRSAAKSAFVLSDFLDREVLSRLAADELSLLEACAVLESFDLSLARDATRADDAPGALRALELHTQLIARIGASGWYRVHGLLAQHLVERLDRDEPDRLLALRRAARAACAARGMRRRALELALDSGDWDEAVVEIEALREELYQQGEWTALLGWLERLPQITLQANPSTALSRARIQMKLGRVRDGLAVLGALDVSLLSDEDRVRADGYRAVALRTLGRTAESANALASARRRLERSRCESASLWAELDLEEAFALASVGQYAGARACAEQAALAFQKLDDAHRAAEANDALAVVMALSGDLDGAAAVFSESERLWQKTGDRRQQLLMEINVAELDRTRGALIPARQRLERALRDGRALNLTRVCAYALENLGAVEHDCGNLSRSEALRSEALKASDEVEDLWLTMVIKLGLALVHRDLGAAEVARAEVEAGLRTAEALDQPLLLFRWRSALGSILITEGRAQEAVAQLRDSLGDNASERDPSDVAVTLLRLAAAHLASQEFDAAMACLVEVGGLIERIGSDSFLCVEARRFPEIVEFGVARAVGPGAFQKLKRELGRAAKHSIPLAPASLPFKIRVRALGDAGIALGEDAIPEGAWQSERAKEMLYFFLWAGRPVRKESVVLALWPDIAPARVNSAFHSTLFRLRRALGKDAVIRTKDSKYRLGETLQVDFDARTLADGLDAGRIAPPSVERDAAIEQLLRLYQGPFLPECDSEWADEARRELAAVVTDARLELAERACASGDWQRALRHAGAVLSDDPLNEGAVLVSLRAHGAVRNWTAASRTYQAYERSMVEECGNRPGPRVRLLYERLVSEAGRADRARAVP